MGAFGCYKSVGTLQARKPQSPTTLSARNHTKPRGRRRSTPLWKAELQKFADETGLRIRVSHYPPGTSKWNKIEHRLFSAITINWRGRPLTTFQTVVDLIGNTTTEAGLKVYALLDKRSYAQGREVADEEMASLRLKRDSFHGEWNYTLLPRRRDEK